MPLPTIAMGLVILLLRVPTDGGYDVLADPVGWVLVVLGTARLTSDRRGLLLGLAVLAGLVATVLWVPALRDPLVGGDPALTWSANLPQLAFTALLTWDLRAHARGSDHRAANWLRTATVLVVVVGLAPAVVFGGGATALAQATYVGAGLVLVLVIALLFSYARRDWVPQRHQPTAG